MVSKKTRCRNDFSVFVYPLPMPFSLSSILAHPCGSRHRSAATAPTPKIITVDRLPDTVRYVAGVDAGFEQQGTITRAAVVVLSFPDLTPVDEALVRCPTTFPYVPGLLSFREIPAMLQALNQIDIEPDIILCDGQGIAHPRRLGIATHLGADD